LKATAEAAAEVMTTEAVVTVAVAAEVSLNGDFHEATIICSKVSHHSFLSAGGYSGGYEDRGRSSGGY